jgi:tetratricopeptide (TPR) repeat protein
MPDPSPTAREAATWLIDDGHPSRLARLAAERVLAPAAGAGEITGREGGVEDEPEQVYAEIRRLRRAANADPRNAIAWAEQARNHAALGQSDAALRSMRRALALAGGHRYFLRAAARLYVHNDECDRAHALLRRAPRTRSDPWLLAAEIAIAELAGRDSPNVAVGRRLLEDGGWQPGHLTELASALATLELRGGRERRARSLFNSSLLAPNDNALAQAEWASERVRGVQTRLVQAREQVPLSYEALSLAAVAAGKTRTAVNQAWRWLLDQPFSAEPAAFGSYHAGQLRDFERALAFAKRGLQANPGHPMLRNNAAFALAHLGRIPEAEAQLDMLRHGDLDADQRAVIAATRGLIAFRSGEPIGAQKLYTEAIERATDPTTRTLAGLMFISEMLRLHLPGAGEAAARARAEAQKKLAPSDRGWIDFIGEGR